MLRGRGGGGERRGAEGSGGERRGGTIPGDVCLGLDLPFFSQSGRLYSTEEHIESRTHTQTHTAVGRRCATWRPKKRQDQSHTYTAFRVLKATWDECPLCRKSAGLTIPAWRPVGARTKQHTAREKKILIFCARMNKIALKRRHPSLTLLLVHGAPKSDWHTRVFRAQT